MKENQGVVIMGGARTPMAEYEGTKGFGRFKDVSAIDLGVHASKAALERSQVGADQIDHVVMGNVVQSSNDSIYGARHVALKSGCLESTPGLTVNRLCGSGIQSAIEGAFLIQSGEAKKVLAGGMENMSQIPHVIHGARSGFRLGEGKMEDLLLAALFDPIPELFMAQTAEKLAKKYQISREEQDEYALRSHQLGSKAVESGVFEKEIIPVTVGKGKREFRVEKDDHIKPDTTLEGLGGLRPAFGKDGTVTAGNASGIVDAAACLTLGHEDQVRSEGLPMLAKIRSWSVVGVDPSIMGIGPCPAIRQALEKANLTLEQIDRFEINEAFSAQYLAVEKELKLNRDRVNVHGGAIALGHPLGATGTRLILTLAMELKRSSLQFGVASACIGGGMGIAMVIESMP